MKHLVRKLKLRNSFTRDISKPLIKRLRPAVKAKYFVRTVVNKTPKRLKLLMHFEEKCSFKVNLTSKFGPNFTPKVKCTIKCA